MGRGPNATREQGNKVMDLPAAAPTGSCAALCFKEQLVLLGLEVYEAPVGSQCVTCSRQIVLRRIREKANS